MEIILAFFLALFLSILLVPVLMKYSSQLRLVDAPDSRKIHSGLIPRVGGIGIALSTLVPCLILISHTNALVGFFISACIIVVFGILDDRFNLDFRLKLLGQAAAACVAIISGISIQHLPLLGFDATTGLVSYPITIVFLIGVTNAFNLLDGLDGLAAGSALLSLAAISFLAALVGDGRDIVIITAAAIG
jgi:UDP-GlcNAc:undecaprenyl-phosphate GlcNAc-1-phosphate transferase